MLPISPASAYFTAFLDDAIDLQREMGSCVARRLSSSLWTSKKGRPGFVFAAASLFQHLRSSSSHDVYDIVG
jgi:hypothetical protein